MENAHELNMAKLVKAATALKAEVPARQIARIKEKILPAITSRAEQVKGPYRKLYETAHNSFSSMADGIRDGEVGTGEFREFLQELTNLQVKAKDLAAAEARPRKQERGADQDSLQILEQQAQRAAGVIQKYKVYENKVPRTLAKKFLATQMPVIPLTKPGFMLDKLDRLKLLDDNLMGYPVLKRQVVLGLNSDWVTSDYKRNTAEAVEDIIQILKDQTGKRYYMVGAPKKRGLVFWAWLATEQTMRQLNSAAFGGHFIMQGWSFPFEPDPEIKMPASRQALQKEAIDKYPSLRFQL